MDQAYKENSSAVGILFPNSNDISNYSLRFPYGTLPNADSINDSPGKHLNCQKVV